MSYKVKHIKRLEEYAPTELAIMLRCEHPQAIAVILSLINPKLAAKILEYFSERLCNDVMLRIPVLDDVRENWLKLLDNAVGRTLGALKKNPNVKFDSMSLAKNILKEMPIDTQTHVHNAVADYDPDLNKRLLES